MSEIKGIDVFKIYQHYGYPFRKIGSYYRSNWCPVCGENSRKSCKVLLTSKYWHCFRCGERGNVFEFIKRVEDVDFKQACKIYNKIAGITNDSYLNRKVVNIKDYKEKTEEELEKELKAKKILIKKILELAKNMEYKESQGYQYLLDRGIPGKVIDKYVNNKFFIIKPNKIIYDYNKKLENIVKEAGLKGLKWLTNREIVFPFYNDKKEIIGAEFRSVEKDTKYPKTLSIGKKISQLWQNGKYKNVMLAEGFIDAFSAEGLGWQGDILVVPGTSHTQEAAKILKKAKYKKIYAAFDADEAGILAAQKLKKYLKNIKNLKIPEGKDLNDLLMQGKKNLDKIIPYSFWEKLCKLVS